MPYPTTWFDAAGVAIQEPPPECVAACAAHGRVDYAVEEWVKELDLAAPPWLLRRYLRGFGAWEPDELCDHAENLKRLLWVWCCNIQESVSAGDPYYLMVLE